MFSRFILMLASSCAFLVEAQTNARRAAPSTTDQKQGGSKKGGRNKAPPAPTVPVEFSFTQVMAQIKLLFAALEEIELAALEQGNADKGEPSAAPSRPGIGGQAPPPKVALRQPMP